ncbi:MAG: hypothetical protein GQ553_04415 [Nitrosomonadaceae bacterium]|nr:hypothetical protein [Nitrosomonadaceae bacterium]
MRTTLLGSASLSMAEGLPMAYYLDRLGIVRGLQRVHPRHIDDLFIGPWGEFSFKFARMTLKKGDGQYGKTKHRVVVVSTRLLTDREKLELAKQLLGE